MKLSTINLSAIDPAEVSEMTAGIRGETPVWTASLRAAIRGGKCLIQFAENDEHRDDARIHAAEAL